MKFKFVVFFILNIFSFSIFSIDLTSDLSLVYNYIGIDRTGDVYKEILKKKFDLAYLKNLTWNKNIIFYVDEFDKLNLKRNINALPFFSHIFMPYGGFSLYKSFGIGFLYGADNLNESGLKLNFATSFSQSENFRQHINFTYPFRFTNDRMKINTTFSFFTSTPQYNSLYYLNKNVNAFYNLFNKAWSLMNINFSNTSETGFYFIQGIDYRIPFIEVNSVSNAGLFFSYTDSKINGFKDENAVLEKINQSNLTFILHQRFVWSKIKQTQTVPVGNELISDFKFNIPSNIGDLGKIFRFTSKLEERFYYKFYKEFFFKIRGIFSLNYNSSSDFSGEPYIRGLKNGENTGFLNFLTNFEIYFPVVDVDMKAAADIVFTTTAKFVLYLNIFVDFGLGIENFKYFLENSIVRNLFPTNDYPFYSISGDYYFVPSLTAGGGIRIYTFFLPFIIRLDVGVNILRAIIKQDPTVDVIISFNEIF
ncbi:MAG TPA: hypothetical protein PLO89_04730 [Spirochaetota bacterium]|nr:hypothetical protein [Spirochaetota bacterium]